MPTRAAETSLPINESPSTRRSSPTRLSRQSKSEHGESFRDSDQRDRAAESVNEAIKDDNTCIPTRGGSIGAKRHVPEQAGGRSNAADRCTALQLQERR